MGSRKGLLEETLTARKEGQGKITFMDGERKREEEDPLRERVRAIYKMGLCPIGLVPTSPS
jgi:hypothetical protein